MNINLPTPADVDAAMARAEAAGATVFMPASDVFWGARYGRLQRSLRPCLGLQRAAGAGLKPEPSARLLRLSGCKLDREDDIRCGHGG